MGRLIISEFKKIFKSKINIALIVIFFGFSAYLNFAAYSPNNYTSDGAEVVKDGKLLNDYEILKSLDEDAKRFSGKMDDAKLKNMRSEYFSLMEATKKGDSIDKDRMIEVFGNDYQTYIDKVNNNEINEDQFWSEYCSEGCVFNVAQDEDGKFQFPIFYKNDGVRRYYNALYYNASGMDTVIGDNSIQNHSNNPYFDLANKKDVLYPNGKNHQNLFYNVEKNSDSEKIAISLSERIEKQNSEYHSTAANNIFLNNVTSGTNVFLLLLIAILLANIFANETHYKTDQIIVPSKKGNTRITIAKCVTGLSIAIGAILVQWGIAFLIACIRLPLHDLSSVVITQHGAYVSVLNYAYTYAEVIVGGLLISVLCAIVCATITMAFSYFTRNRFGTIIPIILFILIPVFLPIGAMLFNISFMDFLFPSKAILFDSLFRPGGIYEGSAFIVMGKDVISMLNINCIVYSIISTILLISMMVHSKKHKVQNR